MKEELLHYIWKFQLFAKNDLTTSGGEAIRVISAGTHNQDAGADFSNARIRIGDTLWAGNVEIHIKSADWEQHRHHHDASHGNTILHVVYEHDREIFRQDGTSPATLELRKYLLPEILQRYEVLQHNLDEIPCSTFLPAVDPAEKTMWLERLAIRRLESKCQPIQVTLEQQVNNWETTFYLHLAQNFGFKTNSVPFEMLARSLPLPVIAKHRNNRSQLEALVFGQAGFLEDKMPDDYSIELQQEYRFLRHKFSLQPIKKHLWKFMRLRPANFPVIRLSQFASLLYGPSHLFSKLVATKNSREYKNLLHVNALGYWQYHSDFGRTTRQLPTALGEQATELLLINTIAPFLFLYGKAKDRPYLQEHAIELLQQLPAEENTIIKRWKKQGWQPADASQSQAMIELYKHYCAVKNCLSCNIGLRILRAGQA